MTEVLQPADIIRQRLAELADRVRTASQHSAQRKKAQRKKGKVIAVGEAGSPDESVQDTVPIPLIPEQVEQEVAQIHEQGFEELLIEQLEPETPPGLLVPILKRLARTKAGRAHSAVCRLIMHYPDEAVQKQGIQYITVLNLDEGERFLQQLTLTDDEVLRNLGKLGCERFHLLSPERSFVNAVIKRPADAVRLQKGIRLERLSQLLSKLPPHEHQQAMHGIQSHTPEIAADVARHIVGHGGMSLSWSESSPGTGETPVAGVPTTTAVRLPSLELLISSAEQAPAEQIEHIVAAGLGAVGRVLRTTGKAVWGEFLRRLLRHPSHREFAFSLLEQSAEYILATVPELRGLLAEEGFPTQISALVLLARVTEVTIPDSHVDHLSEQGVASRWPAWVRLVAERRPMDVIDRWDQLTTPVADMVLQAWLGTQPRSAVRLVWLRFGDWARDGYPTAAALPLARLGAHVAGATGETKAFQPVLRQALYAIAETEGQASQALTIARSIGAEIWLAEPSLLNRLPEREARSLLITLMESHSPEARPPLLARMARGAYEQGLSNASSLLVGNLVDAVLKQPATLTTAVDELRRTPAADRLLQEVGRRMAQLQQAEQLMRVEAGAAGVEARRSLAKAIGHPLGNLEYFLREPCDAGEQGYRRKVARLVQDLRLALGRAGLAPVESDFNQVVFAPHKHQLVPPGSPPPGAVQVMSLGLHLVGEEEPVVPATVVIVREGQE